MHFETNKVYHLYNRGNNRQPVFFSDDNYQLFLHKIKESLLPYSELLCWCLMPNHFHLMLLANNKSCEEKTAFGSGSMQRLSYQTGILLSSYSRIINKQRATIGSLFQQKTKSKEMATELSIIRCMNYIHQNPLKAGLVQSKLEDWTYSSFKDYTGFRKSNLCNQQLLFDLTGYNKEHFLRDSYEVIDPKEYDNLLPRSGRDT